MRGSWFVVRGAWFVVRGAWCQATAIGTKCSSKASRVPYHVIHPHRKPYRSFYFHLTRKYQDTTNHSLHYHYTSIPHTYAHTHIYIYTHTHPHTHTYTYPISTRTHRKSCSYLAHLTWKYLHQLTHTHTAVQLDLPRRQQTSHSLSHSLNRSINYVW